MSDQVFACAQGICTGDIVRTEFGPGRIYSSGPYRVVEVIPRGNYTTLICQHVDQSLRHMRGKFWLNEVHQDGDEWRIGMRSASDRRGEIFVEKAAPLEPRQMTFEELVTS